MDENLDIKLEHWKNESIVDMETVMEMRQANHQTQNQTLPEASAATKRNKTPSRQPTASPSTLSEAPSTPRDSPDAMDVDEFEPSLSTPALVVATDFGTTFSSVAFALHDGEALPDIRMITNYPNDPGYLQGRSGLQVPTESWYSSASQQADIPADMSLDDTAEEDLYDTSDVESDVQSDGYTAEEAVSDNHASPPTDDMESDVQPDGYTAEEAVSDNHASPPTDDVPQVAWGYGIHNAAGSDDSTQFDRIARSKLLLDDSNFTEQVRADLAPTIKRLKKKQIISTELDLITHYLTQLFRHTKQQLCRSYGTPQLPPIEHVLCVPVLWKSQALRTMQSALEKAIRVSQFGTMENLFLVSEPEAAAAYVLRKTKHVNVGEAFLILDAGGGTVDATTYKVSKEAPLRLSKELVDTKGCLNGSSYINQGFRQHMLKRLEGETYLNRDGYTIESIVDKIVVERFENEVKRSTDVTNPSMALERFAIPGLREDSRKCFIKNHILLSRNDFVAIFGPHLRAIWHLVKKQLEDAKKEGHQVKKVVMVGGFSASKSLQKFLDKKLQNLGRAWGYEIRAIGLMHYTGDPEIAVAHGAILRAMNKDEGPDRIPQCSYGFLRTEPFKQFEEHRGVKPYIDELCGQKYIKNTIDWLVKRGEEVTYHKEYIIESDHLFASTRRVFICQEVLYVSDTSTESHYTKWNKKNKGSQVAGTIKADMTFLVKENIIQPITMQSGPYSKGKPHYKIELDLAMIISGRNLRYEARWPRGGEGQVHGGGQICIAAAFQPGTN